MWLLTGLGLIFSCILYSYVDEPELEAACGCGTIGAGESDFGALESGIVGTGEPRFGCGIVSAVTRIVFPTNRPSPPFSPTSSLLNCR
jgi:hypothetical protein